MPAAPRAAAQHALRRDGRRRRRPCVRQPLNLNQRSIILINVLKIYYIHVHNPVGTLRDLTCQTSTATRPSSLNPSVLHDNVYNLDFLDFI